jgi:hypothetical protein
MDVELEIPIRAVKLVKLRFERAEVDNPCPKLPAMPLSPSVLKELLSAGLLLSFNAETAPLPRP